MNWTRPLAPQEVKQTAHLSCKSSCDELHFSFEVLPRVTGSQMRSHPVFSDQTWGTGCRCLGQEVGRLVKRDSEGVLVLLFVFLRVSKVKCFCVRDFFFSSWGTYKWSDQNTLRSPSYLNHIMNLPYVQVHLRVLMFTGIFVKNSAES